MTEPITILIADDEPTVLHALARVFSVDPSFQVVATAGDAEDAARMAETHRPDVALLDVRMPGGGGARCAREIRVLAPETRILALSAYEDRETVVQMLRAGALGYVVKGTAVSEIVDTVRRIAKGEPGFSAEAAAGVMDELSERLQTEEEEVRVRRQRTERVRRVLTGKGIEMVFQPLVDLVSGITQGYEALARFNVAPRQGPDVWFAEAASVGLGIELEVAAVRAALGQLSRLPEGMFMSVNLSPETATAPSFLELLDSVPVDRVAIELTEHAKVEDYEVLNAALLGLRQGGLRLAVDDAGAGFASLRHILKLAPDLIKIDVSITREINTRPAHALAAALHSFAVEIGAAIVAEGIETVEQLETLRKLGIRYGQGYYLARPGQLPEPVQTPVSVHENGG
jgi:EAL domain-containing protein (putative c-di-GMP-specific phosphodiesterase class I)/FixJ family two-component response regulator